MDQSPNTNAAVATALHQIHEPLNHVSEAVLAEALRPRIENIVARILDTVIEQAVYKAVTGKAAPPFILPTSSASGRVTNAMKLCKVDGCGRAVRSKDLCSSHYQKERRAAEEGEEVSGSRKLKLVKANRVRRAKR